jgi:hypothetical protein
LNEENDGLAARLHARMHEAPQQRALAIEEHANHLRIDDPAPRIRDIERREDLRRTLPCAITKNRRRSLPALRLPSPKLSTKLVPARSI